METYSYKEESSKALLSSLKVSFTLISEINPLNVGNVLPRVDLNYLPPAPSSAPASGIGSGSFVNSREILIDSLMPA